MLKLPEASFSCASFGFGRRYRSFALRELEFSFDLLNWLQVLAVELPDDEADGLDTLKLCVFVRARAMPQKDDALIVYEGGAGDEAQCTAPPGPVLVKDLVEEIGHDVSEEAAGHLFLYSRGMSEVQTRQLLQLYPQDFDAVAMPLLLKSRLRRVRERGGKIPEARNPMYSSRYERLMYFLKGQKIRCFFLLLPYTVYYSIYYMYIYIYTNVSI
ncbi:Violaxanthin de-epoxidase [Durusdinium trenchii]|uniref:Chloroplastic n=1 Tax=Durusdinium trenchii TaxID=1381693 RepID=A0ABP0PRZ5_9DINO